MKKLVKEWNIRDAHFAAKKLTNIKRMEYLTGKEMENIDPDRQSFEAVAELKSATDLHDPFLFL